MKKLIAITLVLVSFASTNLLAQQPNADRIVIQDDTLVIYPVNHATMILKYNDKTIYVDPTAAVKSFAALDSLNAPDLILITDIHGDHLSVETLKSLDTDNTVFIVPNAVAQQLPAMFEDQTTVLNNGETATKTGITICAIPMYNLPQSQDAYHVKGRGNGYVLTIGGKRIYIAGDTEDISEMRSLKNIHIAFIPMNLPYTMTVEQAADAVLAFEPTIVYPYHYGDSNIQKFKRLVNEGNAEIEVRLRDWYPNK